MVMPLTIIIKSYVPFQPPDFSILEPFSPPEESQQLLQATTSSPSGVVACPSNTSQLKDFRLEKVDYTFISVFF